MKHKDGSVTIDWKAEEEAIAGIIDNSSHFQITHSYEEAVKGNYPYYMTLWIFFGPNDSGTEWDMGEFNTASQAQRYAVRFLRKLGVKVRDK